MREIKFRAWNKEWGMLLPVDKIFFEDGKPVSISVTIEASDYPHTNEWEDYEIGKDIELMQYTGLKDKNGKEIYEEDIVMADGRKGLAQWNTSEPFYWVRFGENKFNYLQDVIEIEVIGNIYENPELLNPHTT